ncbi:MAG: hypothetical protein PQJ59_09675 [Spirochaetales bacterium]|nr:hypothetical protein [Spirochaetales bacterium]
MINRLSFVIFALLLLPGCTDGLLEDLSRENDNPNTDAPEVTSFVEAGLITISWEEDSCADEYALYRATDSSTPVYEQIYKGTDLSYEDTSIELESRYLYCLYKIRGTESFGPSDSVMGVAASTEMDSYESNDSYEEAVEYTSAINANLFYYNSYNKEHILMDKDYYSITVKPSMTGKYEIDVDNVTDGEQTNMIIQEKGENAAAVNDEGEITFKNDSAETVTFYFYVYLDGDMVGDASGAGSLVCYTLSYTGESTNPD